MGSDKVIAWLLQDDQPSVRYQTLRHLLHRPEDDPETLRAREAIPKKGWAEEILREQLPGGYWDNTARLHRPKYTATLWRFLVLADLGLTSRNAKMRLTCELLLNSCLRPDGGFGFGDESHFCHTGNLARAFITSGYAHDPRVRRALDWIVDAQKEDGGWHCFPSEKGTLDSWEGLSAFAALPRSKWTRRIKRSVERGAEFFLKRQLHSEGRRYAPWFRFHYPVHHYYDLLVGLDVLTALGYGNDSRLGYALKRLREKQASSGRWRMGPLHPDVDAAERKEYYQYEPHWPILFSVEKRGEASRLITLRALRVLARVEAGDR